ncbi:esterase FE4-like [Battus philenor]|uniref:esterase FE4-like n=1 Tax=Battus philenor TaxID=42288 RepID=UPI0035CF0287
MVYIHGGSYSYGSGNNDTYGPHFLLQHDVILVTINYRLEVLGFLCLDTPEVPGNAGMKDQVAALRWVKNNIAHFGGDPNSITIFGESSGACSVTHHMLSPMSRGLFHKVIAQSGTSVHDWAIGGDSIQRAFRAGRVLGKHTTDTKELLNFLRSVKPIQLANLTERTLSFDERYRGLPETFVPVIETKFDGVQAFLDEDPVEMFANGDVYKVPVMVGYNSAEGLLIVSDQVTKLDFYNQHPSYYVPREIAERVSEEKLKEYGNRIKNFYVGHSNITKEEPQLIEKMQSDINFVYNTHRFAHLYSSTGGSLYMYRFNYDTALNVIKIYSEYSFLKGASHADDLFYIFFNLYNEKLYKEREDLKKIIDDVTKLWTNFAKTGNPTPDNSMGVKWELFTPSGKKYLKLEDNMAVDRYAERDRVKFWNRIYKEADVPYIVNNN